MSNSEAMVPLQDSDIATSNPLENEAVEISQLAGSIFTECRIELQISTLDTAIFLLRDVLQQRKPPHPLRYDSLQHLCTALWTRYLQTAQAEDFAESLYVHGESMATMRRANYQAGIQRATGSDDEEDEACTTNDLALSLIKEFHQSVNLDNLNTAIHLYHEALELPDLPTMHRLCSLDSLGAALVMRFQCTRQLHDLHEGISFYRELQPLVRLHPNRSFPLLSLASSILIRSIETGHRQDMLEAATLMEDAIPSYRQKEDLSQAANSLFEKFSGSSSTSDLQRAISLSQEALELRPTLDPSRWSLLNNLGSALCARSKMGHPSDLDKAITIHREAIRLISPHDHKYIFSFKNLVESLQLRFYLRHQLPDLEDSIQLQREALSFSPSGRPELFYDLAHDLSLRYERLCQREDLEEQINCLHKALPHLEIPQLLTDLVNALSERFKQDHDLADLDEAIGLCRQLLNLQSPPDPTRPGALSDLALVLSIRFSSTGKDADLKEAMELCHAALDLQPSEVIHSEVLHTLGTVFSAKFGQSATLSDLDKAITYCRESLVMKSGNRWRLLYDLGAYLYERFFRTSQLSDLEDSIELHREALKLRASPSRERGSSLINLGHALAQRFERTNQFCDLEEAIAFNREALTLFPSPIPSHLGALATALGKQFEHTGQSSDLEEVILLCYQALALQPTSHGGRESLLHSLATALVTRFTQGGELLDLEHAITLFRELLHFQPSSHLDRWLLISNLACALGEQFKRTKQLLDLEESIAFFHEALDLQPSSHASRSTLLNNLGINLYTKFQLTGQHSYLEESIALYREALALTKSAQPDRLLFLNNLGNALAQSFAYTEQHSDMDEAIALYQEGIQFISKDHPGLATISDNLATHLIFFYSKDKQSKYLTGAMDAFRVAAKSEHSPTLTRFSSAKTWAKEAELHDHSTALEAYQSAIALLPRLATLGLDLKARQQILISRTDLLACNAACCAINAGQIEKAVELLEHGRTIFWSQALQLRTPLDELMTVSPILAEKLRTISTALEQGSQRDVSRQNNMAMEKQMSLEQETSHFRRLNDEYLDILNEIRQLDRFKDFLLPNSVESLRLAAANGPIVILNGAKSQCDALIITSTTIGCVPLPNVDYSHPKSLHMILQAALSSNGTSPVLLKEARSLLQASSQTRLHAARVSDEDYMKPEILLQGVLWLLWKDIVQPVLQFLNLQKSTSPPRLWWCPTGPFAFLPLHAAGDNDDWVFDYVVSSYTPTLSALLKRSPPVLTDDTFKMAVTIEPSSLPFTTKELSKIEACVPEKYLDKLDTHTPVETVLEHLSEAAIAHFACHGHQDPTDPLKSHLLLASGPLELSRLMERPMPNATLAFLSACETAMGDENCADEVIHIAATMLFAGFRGVVGTMWSMADSDGPRIAESFYQHLFQTNGSQSTGLPDTSEAARALHLAVAKLRTEENCTLKRWVPFIHVGI